MPTLSVADLGTSPPTITPVLDIFGTDAVIDNNRCYVLDMVNGLAIIDVANPSNPALLTSPFFPAVQYAGFREGTGLAVNGQFVYIADDVNGLVVVDVSNPSSPFEIERFVPQNPNVQRHALSGQYAYVADYNNGLLIIGGLPGLP